MNYILSFFNVETLILVLAFVAVLATIVTLALPYLQTDRLAARLGSVAKQRSAMKTKARAVREAKKAPGLRQTASGYKQKIVERLDLRKLLEAPETRLHLAQAGFRGQGPLWTFLFFRLIMPPILFFGAMFYLFVLEASDQPAPIKFLMALGAAAAGFYLPNIYLQNLINKRKLSIGRAFPDALDLMLICVEAGMTIEVAFNRVGREIGSQSVELAE